MPSFIPKSMPARLAIGEINFERGNFAVMLLDSSRVPDEDSADRRDLDSEVSGQGYTEGGKAVDVSVYTDADGRTGIVLGGATWNPSTIAARYAAYYQRTRNPASDALIAVIDFGREVQSSNDLFSLAESEIEIRTR